MKLDFINRGASSRLILIFAGWSTDARYYIDCTADGWDTAVLSDYRDLSMPPLPAQYSTIYIFAYSLGVWAAAQTDLHAAARIAICGTPVPVSNEYGIPEAVFKGTADALSAKSLKKFHLRMAGDKTRFDSIADHLPSSPNIENLRDELYSIAFNVAYDKGYKHDWDKVYIADNDRIIPSANQERYWSQYADMLKVTLESSHAAPIADIVKECIPDPNGIGKGFERAISTYNDNAVIQAEICDRIGLKLHELLANRQNNVESLLEVGVGNGLLTEVWRKIVIPLKADFIDLIETRNFGIAEEERYIVGDAEQWLDKSTDSYDLILSASAIQWFADPISFIMKVKDHLNRGGIAIISTFVKGNLHQLDAIRPCPLIYRSIEEYKKIPNIEIIEWESTLTFSSSREMLKHLLLTGVTPRHKTYTSVLPSEHSQKRMSNLPKELTYHPIILVLTV